MYIYLEQVIFVQYADKILELINIIFKALEVELQVAYECLILCFTGRFVYDNGHIYK